MTQRYWLVILILAWLAFTPMRPGQVAAATHRPEGTLTVAVATFGNERWLPHLYVGAEDIVLKPLYENLLHRGTHTGELSPMLAERWEVIDGGRAWKFYLRRGG
jgi:ABC-type transport system substrate-binding protein